MAVGHIVSAERAYAHAGGDAGAIHRHMATELARQGALGTAMATVALPTSTAGAKAKVPAYINDSRWIVTCPDCNESQIVAKGDARFLCFDCKNFVVEGQWRPVEFPADLDVIEEELLTWPGKDAAGRLLMRNWHPHESLAALRKRKLDNLRPSIPQREDLSDAELALIDELHVANRHALGQGDEPPPVPEVVWDDDERTLPRIKWPKGVKAPARRAR